MSKERNSSIELLRIISMLLVMLIHVSYAVGAQGTTFGESVLGATVQWACMICVNIFVLISGWFGIHYRQEGIWKLVYQTVFLSLTAYAFCVVSGNATFDIGGIWHCTLGVFSVYWFVWAYLLLYILSPVLNAFVDHAPRKEFLGVLLGFYAFALFAYCTLRVDPIFSKGFHTMAFIGIYLLGRYMRLYRPRWTTWPRRVDALIYVASVAIAVCSVLMLEQMEEGTEVIMQKLSSYIAPTTMVGTVFFFLFFEKLSFRSKYINHCAASAFAAFILHMQFDMHSLYNKFFQDLYSSLHFILFWPVALLCIVAMFGICVMVDQVRLFTWNKLFKA